MGVPGPAALRERSAAASTPTAIAAMDPDEFVAVFWPSPALHRFPGSMAKRVHGPVPAPRRHLRRRRRRLWNEARTGDELFRRLRELPGYGEEKAKIFVAILAKRFGAVARPAGRRRPRPSPTTTPRSVADIGSRPSRGKVRAARRPKKAKGKGKAD